jgi:hypothetical protein
MFYWGEGENLITLSSVGSLSKRSELLGRGGGANLLPLSNIGSLFKQSELLEADKFIST